MTKHEMSILENGDNMSEVSEKGLKTQYHFRHVERIVLNNSEAWVACMNY